MDTHAHDVCHPVPSFLSSSNVSARQALLSGNADALVHPEGLCCVQIQVKRRPRQRDAKHRAGAVVGLQAVEDGDPAGSDNTGEDMVMYAGSQRALLGAVEVRR